MAVVPNRAGKIPRYGVEMTPKLIIELPYYKSVGWRAAHSNQRELHADV